MRVRVPGDKSLTQRALLLASAAEGTSRLAGLLHGGDAASTAAALRAAGAVIPRLPPGGGEILVEGTGPRGLRPPDAPLDLGNSGTGARLLLGLLAGTPATATLTGDASLRSRPMERVAAPLRAMGAEVEPLEGAGRLPLRVRGRRPLRHLDWPSPVASAQVKSAILLAGLVGGAPVHVTEPRRSRDHTERMLLGLGVSVISHAVERGWRVELRDPPASLPPLDFRVPGDPSSAAFLLALAALGGAAGPLEIEDVGLNPTRTAFLDVLRRMGATVDRAPAGGDAAEPVGTVGCGPADLVATTVGGDEIPALIDELPLVAILGAHAEGVTRIREAAELRHKESDRIRALVENLRALGAEVEEHADGLEVAGSDRPLRGRIETRGDHRIAMAFAVLGARPGNQVEVDDPSAADVSFPGFWALLERLRGARTA